MAELRAFVHTLCVPSALTFDRVRSDIEVLSRAGLDMATFMAELDESLQRAVPHVAACLATVDPATLLLTSTYKFGDLYGKDEHDMEWSLHEYGGDSPTSFMNLVGRPTPATSVHIETGGRLHECTRMERLINNYFSYTDEARMVGRQGGCTWGGLAIFRGPGEAPFSEAEVAYLASLSDTYATGLRSGLLARLAGSLVEHREVGPAVVIVGRDNRVAQTSMGAEGLLRELASAPNMADTSGTIFSLVAWARAFAAGRVDRLPRARVRMPSGRWLVLNASPLAGPDGPSGEVVISIEEARPPEIVPLVVSAFQLTPRERDVTQLVLQGVDTKDIAKALNLSRYTVQDHLKSVFEKADVRSRRELVSRVYFDQYMPRMGEDLAPSGWFAPALPAAASGGHDTPVDV
jgi:DNA-binding CsgD family transcriptional regulator